jgi:16S rRNA (guanine966-N2)-methyltransferase
MRVIAGTLGGRNFDAPHGHHTHPMGEKVRGALFNALGDITGLSVLDAYAGSGALAFEALSRGARSALLVDSDTEAQKAILKNIKRLGVETSTKLFSASVVGWSRRKQQDIFDVVMADPPYDKVSVLEIQKLVKHVGPSGTFVLSWPQMLEIPKFEGLEVIKQKAYAESPQLIFYKRI